jgi:hypothetical protein
MDSFVLNSSVNPASIDVSWAPDGNQVLLRNSTALDGIAVVDGSRHTIVVFADITNNTVVVPVDGVTMSPDSRYVSACCVLRLSSSRFSCTFCSGGCCWTLTT